LGSSGHTDAALILILGEAFGDITLVADDEVGFMRHLGLLSGGNFRFLDSIQQTGVVIDDLSGILTIQTQNYLDRALTYLTSEV
jgi:hypothetical protein